MKRICFDTVCEAFAYGLDKYSDLIESGVEFPTVEYVGDYYIISDLLEHFIAEGFSLESVQIENPEIYDYDKEYILVVGVEGIYVAPIWRRKNEWHDAGYYTIGADYVFVHEDCNSRILSHIDSQEKDIIEFGIGEYELEELDDDCDGNCECCEFGEHEPEISVKVNGKEVFGDEADEAVRKALLQYCELMDARNNLLSRFW